MVDLTHQRKGAISNAHVGRDFELLCAQLFGEQGLHLTSDFALPVGVGSIKKPHKYDLGGDDPKIIVECKSQTWTAGNKVPSAKLKNWAEAMYYFHMAPAEYRKVFIVERSVRETTGETLLEYFQRTHPHLIPNDVELMELDKETRTLCILGEK